MFAVLRSLLQLMPEAIVPMVQILTSIILLFIYSWRLTVGAHVCTWRHPFSGVCPHAQHAIPAPAQVLISSILVFFVMFTVWRNFYTAMFQKKYLDSVRSPCSVRLIVDRPCSPRSTALPLPSNGHRILHQRDRERYLTMDVFEGFDAVQLYAMENHERGRLKKLLAETLKLARKLYAIDIFGDFVESQVRRSCDEQRMRNGSAVDDRCCTHLSGISPWQLLTAAVIVGVGYGTTLVQAQSGLTSENLAMYGTVAFQVTMAIKQVCSEQYYLR
jgi:ABC-type multidrug transport system fused ATPase/permease subunit